MNEIYKIGHQIVYKELGWHGIIIDILPVTKYRPKPLYCIKYDNGKNGILELKDFK